MGKIEVDSNTELGQMIIRYDQLMEKFQISSREIEVLKLYTGCSDKFLYSSMYGIKEQDKERFKQFKKGFTGSKEFISFSKLITLDNLIKRFGIKDELVLYRGTKDSNFRNTSIIDGENVTFISLASTSLDKFTACYYTSSDEPLLLEIHLPIKYPALWLKPFSLFPMECEFLLASKSKFKIEEVTSENISNKEAKKIILRGIK